MYDIAPHNKWYRLFRTISHWYRPYIIPNVLKTYLLFRFFLFIGIGASICLILLNCETWLPFFFKYIVSGVWKYVCNQPLLHITIAYNWCKPLICLFYISVNAYSVVNLTFEQFHKKILQHNLLFCNHLRKWRK
jgi:hypothetical protein